MALYNGTNKPNFPARRDPLPGGPYAWVGNPPEFCPGGPVVSIPKELTEQRITVNKTTHRIRFESETESEVVVVIELKE